MDQITTKVYADYIVLKAKSDPIKLIEGHSLGDSVIRFQSGENQMMKNENFMEVVNFMNQEMGSEFNGMPMVYKNVKAIIEAYIKHKEVKNEHGSNDSAQGRENI